MNNQKIIDDAREAGFAVQADTNQLYIEFGSGYKVDITYELAKFAELTLKREREREQPTPSQSDEAFKESVSDLRKYSYEFSHSKDMETYDLMIAAQVNLHKLFDAERAKLAEHEQPTPSQSDDEPAVTVRDIDDEFRGVMYKELQDLPAGTKLYTKPQPTSQDTARLDKLQALTKGYGKGWILRDSGIGRGMRLHETDQDGASPTVREAIDAMKEAGLDG